MLTAYFAHNIQGCKENNIPYGVYIYSYASNTEMAKREVSHVLRLIRETNANPTFPIYYDIEAKEQENLSSTMLGNIAETFCNEIVKEGYKVGILEKADVNILLARECSVSGHTYELQSVIKKVTTTQPGEATYQCKACGSNKTEFTPKLKSVSLSKTSYVYTGKAIKSTVTVKDSSGKIIPNSYYRVLYS